ncbi:MAG: peptide chain release factor N(5)-glutamine methyltransferase [Hyphomicrobiaceae bacterium]|nr:peptide chain release factor N(5)-glutamine methyltransferase [Hyphomicrobiaceae bacterium]
MTLESLWRGAARQLTEAGIAGADRDAQLLLMAAAGIDQTRLVLGRAEPPSSDAIAAYQAMIARRLGGEPVARIVGQKQFYGLDFRLGPETLVPRPETELLVDLGVAFCKGRPKPHLLDLGTGTGAILVTLLVQLPEATGIGVDISAGALSVARENAMRHGVADRSDWRQGSWFAPVSATTRFDLIVSNPPYIVRGVLPGLSREVREHDPIAALDGGEDGLDAYRAILADAGRHLADGGMLIFEIGYDQGEAVTGLCRNAGFSRCRIEPDLAGHDRVLVARM